MRWLRLEGSDYLVEYAGASVNLIDPRDARTTLTLNGRGDADATELTSITLNGEATLVVSYSDGEVVLWRHDGEQVAVLGRSDGLERLVHRTVGELLPS